MLTDEEVEQIDMELKMEQPLDQSEETGEQ